jgi:hypothetical protein
MGFTDAELDLLTIASEVVIETHGGGRSYRTVIWVSVDEGDVYLRSVRGASGRWYRRVLADPAVTLHAAGTHIPAQAVPAGDAASVERASAGLRRKYPKSGSLDAMLLPDVLDTTLRLEPAG